MIEKLQKIRQEFIKEIDEIRNFKDFGKIRVKYLGRKSELTEILGSLKNLSVEERREIGAKANAIRKEIQDLVQEKIDDLNYRRSLMAPVLDITKPAKKIESGHIHILAKVEDEMNQIFSSMNFSIVEGPEVENEQYNFDALNIPQNHPSREMWDTFWLKQAKTKNRLLLRTHTSPVQIRYMEKYNPPFQIIAPGRVFRYEATDASHEINFYQLEGLMVGKDVSLANFKFVIEEFFKKFFKGQKIEFRFRPSYFPFVEPGVEVDIKLDKGGWLEVMGAGMVHRNVFDAVRYNSNEWQGFAFGMGIDRLAMIKYKIPDIRLFYSGDLRFIKQF
ncbi:MAG: phenylalanine--tRNA ligase subunit alpha [Patescibacteria group bacterium]